MKDITRFHTDLQEILGMLKYRENKEELVKYLREREHYFRNVDEETYYAIREFLHSEKILKIEVSKHLGKEKIDMCKALEDLYKDGLNEGINQGIDQGISQGIMLGEEKLLLKQIRAKISKKMKIEEIAEALEVSVETITALMAKIS